MKALLPVIHFGPQGQIENCFLRWRSVISTKFPTDAAAGVITEPDRSGLTDKSKPIERVNEWAGQAANQWEHTRYNNERELQGQ